MSDGPTRDLCTGGDSDPGPLVTAGGWRLEGSGRCRCFSFSGRTTFVLKTQTEAWLMWVCGGEVGIRVGGLFTKPALTAAVSHLLPEGAAGPLFASHLCLWL